MKREYTTKEKKERISVMMIALVICLISVLSIPLLVRAESAVAPATTQVQEEGTVIIEEEEVPLAPDIRYENTYGHWVAIILTVAFAGFAVMRCVSRQRAIKELEIELKTGRVPL
ncbi:MAG: hypothetical protein IKL78_02900 [Lachnospiraceae bacterium]|nr:hypothetical protein [Lachnospiraceae bacterium]